MTNGASRRATVADLHDVEGQAELVDGVVVRIRPLGHKPACIVMEIACSLRDYEPTLGRGETYTSTLAYIVPRLRSGRESFSPDVSYYVGPWPDNPMGFIEGPPTFAVEVRNEFEYGPDAEATMAAKRAEYFEAGTLVVWDIDPIQDRIFSYRVADPTNPTTFDRGEVADAEPAVPGWRIDVAGIFG